MPLCEKEEREFAMLHDKCRELKVMPPPAIFIGLKVEKGGSVLLEDMQRGHSWTRNYWNMLFSIAAFSAGTTNTYDAGYLCSKEVGGTVRVSTAYGCGINNRRAADGYNFRQAASSDASGIVVGTDDTAFDVNGHTLVAKITHGNTAGKLTYGDCVAGTLSYNSESKLWKQLWGRVFYNDTDAAITVKETGLIYLAGNADAVFFSGLSSQYLLLERSVLADPVTVPVGAQLTVTYEITMDFSAID